MGQKRPSDRGERQLGSLTAYSKLWSGKQCAWCQVNVSCREGHAAVLLGANYKDKFYQVPVNHCKSSQVPGQLEDRDMKVFRRNSLQANLSLCPSE